MRSATLCRVLAVLLVLIAVALGWNHFGELNRDLLDPAPRTLLGIAAGVGIVAALMGIAGGELLIPAIVLLFAVDIKIAGSLALAISLPTMLVAFARYSGDRSFAVLRANKGFVLAMATGSIIGTIIGGVLLGAVPESVLIPLLVALLLVSSVKVWRDDRQSNSLFPRCSLSPPGRLARGEPIRAAGHVRRIIPGDVI
jgi:uncharacterized protein